MELREEGFEWSCMAVCAQSACQVVLWEVGKKFCDDMLAERSLPLDTPGTCRKVMSEHTLMCVPQTTVDSHADVCSHPDVCSTNHS